MKTYAIDFEVYYDKEVGIKTLGVWHYLRHPLAKIYLMSIKGPDLEYVGPPEGAPWEKINGHRWVAHNYAFDGAVVNRLIELGVIPAHVRPADFNCTANMAVYFSAPRNLAGAAQELLDTAVSKDMRSWMKGRTWEEAVREGKAEALMDYGLRDSVICYRLWEKYSPQWPEFEQWLSHHSIMIGWRGVATDMEMLESSINTLQKIKWRAQQALPFHKPGAKGLSLVAFHQSCRDAGIEPPPTTAADDERCIKWEEEHTEITWVREMRIWRKANTALTKLLKLRDRTRPDGTVSFGLKYGGAHTLRWSGEGGFNMQNHNRDALVWSDEHGFETPDDYTGEIVRIDVREHLIPRPGKKFGIVDLEQIEPRTLAWISKDREFLKLCVSMSPYEAHARLYMGWTGGNLKKENKKLYALAKARVLALGYGAGWEKFIVMCRTYGIKPEEVLADPVSKQQLEGFLSSLARNKKAKGKITEFEGLDEVTQRIWVNAWLQVMDFRNKNQRTILKLWSELEYGFKSSEGETYEMGLPSGRELHYFNVTSTNGDWRAQTERGGDFEKFYGGKLCENLIQATARDVFAEGVRRVETAGYPVIFHVHDEVVTEINDESDLQIVIQLMSQTPAWLKGCPIAAAGEIADHYQK